MTTPERELTAPVDLCLADGIHLNPAAKGWSRRPLHNANLRGARGRTKRWDYWAILTGDLVIAVTYADVDYLGIVAVEWFDLATDEKGGRKVATPGALGLSLPDVPGSAPLAFHRRSLRLDVTDDVHGTTIRARWRERDGTASALDACVALPKCHESLNVVIPWSETRFQYTSKHQARRVTRALRRGSETTRLEGAYAVLDVGRGRWPYRTRWNSGGGAGRARDGAVIGLQLGGKWTVGTGATENGVLVDGRLTKLGDELAWEYDLRHPLRPWRVRAPGGEVDLVLTPRYDRHVKVNALVLGIEVHQVFGTWSGDVRTDEGAVHRLEGIAGFAEESRSRW